MRYINEKLKFKTKEVDIIDLTPSIKEFMLKNRISNGSVLVFTKHTTTAIRINESEIRLLKDIRLALENMVPMNAKYFHDDIELRDCPPDERINGHSHIKALSLNSSECIPIVDGKLALGKWQSVLFFELDGSREREVIVQISGE